jgi:hypothetical protein
MHCAVGAVAAAAAAVAAAAGYTASLVEFTPPLKLISDPMPDFVWIRGG